MSKPKPGIFIVDFGQDGQMVFGNNYKAWWEHAREYIYRRYGNKEHGWRYDDVARKVKFVLYSNQPFYDNGGLKWCPAEQYQEVIDEVCKKQELASVKNEEIISRESHGDYSLLIKKLREY